MKDQNLSRSDVRVVMPDQTIKVALSGGREYIVRVHNGRRIPTHCLEFPISIHTPLAKAILGKKKNDRHLQGGESY